MNETTKNLPPTIEPLAVRCPVPYCQSAPAYKCINRDGFYLCNAHRQRHKAARLLTEAPSPAGRDER